MKTVWHEHGGIEWDSPDSDHSELLEKALTKERRSAVKLFLKENRFEITSGGLLHASFGFGVDQYVSWKEVMQETFDVSEEDWLLEFLPGVISDFRRVLKQLENKLSEIQ